MDQLLKLNVGCGAKPTPGFVNCDYVSHSGVDVVFDAQKNWPFPDNSVGQVISYHALEHMENWAGFFREMWRVLAPSGMVSMQLPYGPSIDGMAEPGHVKYWLPTSFCVLQPGYAEAVGNLQHEKMSASFEVTFIGCTVNKHLLWMARRPWRRWGLRALWYLFSGHTEMIVGLQALKTQEQIEDYLKRKPPKHGSCVSVAQCAWLHQWNPKEWAKKGHPAELVIFESGLGVVFSNSMGMI